MVDLFNEFSLRADIAKTWGEHGAHIDVFDMMLKKIKETVFDLDAGFGIPINIRSDAPIHWWTPTNKKACDPDGLTMHFAGDRVVTKEDLQDRGVCMPCLIAVVKASEIMGLPKDFPIDLKVRIR